MLNNAKTQDKTNVYSWQSELCFNVHVMLSWVLGAHHRHRDHGLATEGL